MGLIVDVYRRAGGGDCSLSGISSRHDELTVVNVDGPFDPKDERPAVALIFRETGKNAVLVPAVLDVEATEEEGSPVYQAIRQDLVASGGNLAASSDSRWRRAVSRGGPDVMAVPVHDRLHSKEAALEVALNAIAEERSRQREEWECTGWSAQWCPVHGDCMCDRDDDWRYGGGFTPDPGCPLHADESTHPPGPISSPTEKRRKRWLSGS